MKASVLVEFCGLPGSGKTTLAAAVRTTVAGALDGAAATRTDVPPFHRLRRKLVLVTRAGVHDPVGTARVAGRVLLGSRTQPVEGAGRVVQWTVGQRLLAGARSRGGVHLFDEGVVQALWSMGLRSDVSPILDLLARAPHRWFRPDLIVVVDEPVDLALSRLRQRRSRHSRTQRLPWDEQATELRAGRELLSRLVAWSAAQPHAPAILRVTPSVEARAAQLVADRVKELIRLSRHECGSSGSFHVG